MRPMILRIPSNIKCVFQENSGRKDWMDPLFFFIKNGPLKIWITLILIVVAGLAQATTYYSGPGTTDPANKNSWWTNTNATGTHPAVWTNIADVFINQTGHTMTALNGWSMSGTFVVNGTFNGNNKDHVLGALTVNMGGVFNSSTSGNHKLTVSRTT